MIKKLVIEFCEANGKYDSFMDGEWTGKWYSLVSALNGHMIRAKESDKELKE